MAPDPNSSGGTSSGSRNEAAVKVPAKDPKKKDDKKDEDLVISHSLLSSIFPSSVCLVADKV